MAKMVFDRGSSKNQRPNIHRHLTAAKKCSPKPRFELIEIQGQRTRFFFNNFVELEKMYEKNEENFVKL